jgi:hypothetical protein
VLNPRIAIARSSFVPFLTAAGFALAVAAAGCGSSGNSGNVATRVESVSVTRSTADQPTTTREAVVTRTETQPAQTQTIQQTQTVQQTHTVQQTVTQTPAVTSAAVTVTETGSSSGTPGWVWLLVGLGVVGLAALVVRLIRGGGAHASPEERQRAVMMGIQSWVAQGWAIENQTESAAVLRRDGERIVLNFDPEGRMTSAPLGPVG